MNYSNQMLHTMAKKLDIIENFVLHPKDVKKFKIYPTPPIYHYHTSSTQELNSMSLSRDANYKIKELIEKLKILNMGNS